MKRPTTSEYVSLIGWYLTIAFTAIICTIWACSAPAKNAQMVIADVVVQAANDTAPALADLYKGDLQACLGDAGTKADYKACTLQVDLQWAKTRDAWDRLAHLQAAYANALEKHDASVSDYVQWIQIAFCEVRSVAPDDTEFGQALSAGAAVARTTAGNFAPTSKAAIVGNTTAALLDLAAKFARRGFSPVEHITRLVELGAAMDAAKAEVDAEADAR